MEEIPKLTNEQFAAALNSSTANFLKGYEKQKEHERIHGRPPNPMEFSPTRMSFWFPLIQAAGLPVPKTSTIFVPDEVHHEIELAVGGEPDMQEKHKGGLKIHNFMIGGAAKLLVGEGNPFFLRTDFTSGKHDWKDTCMVKDWSLLDNHIARLIEFSQLIDHPSRIFHVRELLNVKPLFHAFGGQMPITREFRFFVRDGVIEHVQPYWPPDAIKLADKQDWKALLQAVNVLTPQEQAHLGKLCSRVGEVVKGFWSVDFLETTDRGWVLTDMAEGVKSYRWEPEKAVYDKDDVELDYDMILIAGGVRTPYSEEWEKIPGKPLLTIEHLKMVPKEDREKAVEWASAVHLHASDNDDVKVPPCPEFLKPFRD